MRALPVHLRCQSRRFSQLLAIAIGATTIHLTTAAVGWGQIMESVAIDAAETSEPAPPSAVDLLGQTLADPAEDAPEGTAPLPLEEPTTEELVPEEPAPAGQGQRIAEVQVRFIDEAGEPTEGVTRPFIVTREFDLQVGDVYDPLLAQQGLDRVVNLNSVERASLQLEPAADPTQVVMVVSVEEEAPFVLRLETTAPVPSALQGPFQRRSVQQAAPIEDGGFAISGSALFRNVGGNDQDLAVQVRGGENVLNGEVRFIDPWIGGDPARTGYAVNFFNQRSVQRVFTDGDRDVDLPGGGDPWVHRLGGGVEVFRPLGENFTGALGVSYQRVSVRDGVFSSGLEPEDEEGNELTVSDRGADDLLTLNFSGAIDRRNDPRFPSDGSLFLFGVDQAIPIGDASIAFTRLSARYLEYVPLPLFGFAEGPEFLILSLQGGTTFGDVPPYEAFNLDTGPVRGYGGRELGTGTSFLQAAAEYRFPIANFDLFEQPINLIGAVFVGYSTDLGTADEVIGEPSVVRDKSGSGFATGIGIRARTPIGLVRLELGFGEDGSEVILTTGDRF